MRSLGNPLNLRQGIMKMMMTMILGNDVVSGKKNTEVSSSRGKYVPVREPNKRARLERGVDDMVKAIGET